MPKVQGKNKTLQNSLNQPPRLDSKLSKKRDRKEYSRQRYQTKKQEYHEWYLKRKNQQEVKEKEQLSKYSIAENYKVLMSLKEYTELNQTKKKKLLDFVQTLKELNQFGIHNIIEIMRIRELSDNLIMDYWTTAKNEEKQKGKSWNSLEQEQKDRLIRYWGQEKVRKEQKLLTDLERQEQAGKEYLKEIEMTKFHEERGKVKCPCYDCESKREIQAEVKTKMNKEINDYERKNQGDKEQCSECGRWVNELDEENDLCKRCMRQYE